MKTKCSLISQGAKVVFIFYFFFNSIVDISAGLSRDAALDAPDGRFQISNKPASSVLRVAENTFDCSFSRRMDGVQS